jgi:hypothetical protein
VHKSTNRKRETDLFQSCFQNNRQLISIHRLKINFRRWVYQTTDKEINTLPAIQEYTHILSTNT